MAQAQDLIQLATRVPRDLHRKLKLHCVKENVAVMEFVTRAIEKALGKNGK